MRALWRRHSLLPVLCAALAVASAHAQSPSVLGYWREPGGSVIRIAACGQELCVEIVKLPDAKLLAAKIRAADPPLTDRRNPDPKLRSRPLCGLQIGAGFVAVDPQHARGGHLYDPRNGHTYSGQMTAEGNLLHLRGYVGLPIFGRSQTWVRTSQPPHC